MDQLVSPTPKETQVVKLECSSAKVKHETVEKCTMSGENGGSVGRKKKRDSHKSSKERKVEKLEMGMTDVSMAAQKDLEFERKLSKKLKVKEGKLRGMDDGLNLLLEGMSSFTDLFGEGEDSDNGELPKKRSKKSSSSEKHKLPKEWMEAESLDGKLGPVETSDQDVALEEVPDSVTSRKKHKKRKLSSQEQEDNVEDGTVCTVKPVESSGKDVASGDVPVEVPRKKDIKKYILPQLRARAGNEPDEHTQIRRLVKRKDGRVFVLI